MIEFGAEIDYPNSKTKKTPLHYALDSQAENCDVVTYLIKTEKVDVDFVSTEGWTPLLLSALKKRASTL